MDLKRCLNGHFYDGDSYACCPHCGAASAAAAPSNMAGAVDNFAGTNFAADDFEGNKTEKLDLGFADSFAPEAPAENTAQATTALSDLIGNVKAAADDDDDDEQAKTVGYYENAIGSNPVVGWLVCIEGQHFGEDFRLRAGKNFIGRASNMDVCLKGDNAVSREKHLIVLYDPNTNVFVCQAGESKELSYHNDNLLLSPVELKPYDVLKIGASKLMFVPLCSDAFTWKIVDGDK